MIHEGDLESVYADIGDVFGGPLLYVGVVPMFHVETSDSSITLAVSPRYGRTTYP
jgi:hypothetical protein